MSIRKVRVDPSERPTKKRTSYGLLDRSKPKPKGKGDFGYSKKEKPKMSFRGAVGKATTKTYTVKTGKKQYSSVSATPEKLRRKTI